MGISIKNAAYGPKVVADGNYFTGNQAQTKIYNRSLTAAEIQQNFNALRGRFSI